MINIEGAITYFGTASHPLSRRWNGFEADDQTAAVATARRQLSRKMARAMDDNEAAYVEGDTTRDEFAVYEQAIHLLMNTTFPNTEQSGPSFASQDGIDEPRERDAAEFAPAALAWLGIQQLSFSRG